MMVLENFLQVLKISSKFLKVDIFWPILKLKLIEVNELFKTV